MADSGREDVGLKRLFTFVLIAVIGLAISYFTPLRDYLKVDTVRAFAENVGLWGPAILLAVGIVTPLLFLPRWPVCFAAGLLYGVVWGSIVANIACTIGAWVHYLTSKSLVGQSSGRLLKKYNLDPAKIPPGKAFLLLFILRAFPLSNSAATNVLAGALHLTSGSFLLATFVGMIPSTLMYTAWGKLMKKPGPEFYFLALLVLVLIVAGSYFGKRYISSLMDEKRSAE